MAIEPVSIWGPLSGDTRLINDIVSDWKEFLGLEPSNEDIKTLQRHERTGRPLGDESFITSLEKSIGRLLKSKKSGRKLKQGIN